MKFTDALAKLRTMTRGYCSVYTPEHSHTYPAKENWEAALQDLQDKMDGTLPRPLEGAPE